VVGDVLDLVRARSGVRLLKLRQHVGERLARRVNAQDARRDAALKLRRQLRGHPLRLEGGIADRLRAEWIEMGGEMPVHPQRLDERHRRCDAGDQLVVGDRCGRGLGWRGSGRRRRCLGGIRVAVRLAKILQQAREARQRLDQVPVAALEERPPLRRDGFGVLEVVLEQRARVTGVDCVDVRHGWSLLL
jgi:hypothetical protein